PLCASRHLSRSTSTRSLFPYPTLFRSPQQQPAFGPFGRRVEVQLVEHFDVSGTGQRSRPEGVGDLGDLIDPSVLVIDAELTCRGDRKSTRLNSSHVSISYAVFCLKNRT